MGKLHVGRGNGKRGLRAALKDKRRLNARDQRVAGKSIKSQIPQMFDIPHRHMNDQIVTPADQVRAAHFGDRFDLAQEAIDRRPAVFRQLDKQKSLQIQADGTQIHVGVGTANDPGFVEPLDALVARGWSQPYSGGDLFIR